MPDLWYNMSCDGDELQADGDCFETSNGEKALELSPFHEDSLLCDLTFNGEIPDMECFRETSQEEINTQMIISLFTKTHKLVLQRVLCC